jgi:hypothetical protein
MLRNETVEGFSSRDRVATSPAALHKGTNSVTCVSWPIAPHPVSYVRAPKATDTLGLPASMPIFIFMFIFSILFVSISVEESREPDFQLRAVPSDRCSAPKKRQCPRYKCSQREKNKKSEKVKKLWKKCHHGDTKKKKKKRVTC